LNMGNTCLRDEDEDDYDSVEQDVLLFNTQSMHRQRRGESDSTICSSDEEEEEGDISDVGESKEYFWIFDGIIGSGRTSTLNTFLNKNLCKVAGGQVQGTRGASMELFTPESLEELQHPVNFVDIEGFRSDVPAKHEEVLAHLELLSNCMSQSEPLQSKFCSNVSLHQYFFVLDLQQRLTAPILDNLLMLTDMYFPVRSQCVLCFTKWNSNAVMSEWNHKLRVWCRKYKRSFEDFSEKYVANMDELPSTNEMLLDYVDFLKNKFGTETELRVLEKAIKLFTFFQDRLLWVFNLDCLETEDREDGELPPYKEFMYIHYREIVLAKLRLHYAQLRLQGKQNPDACNRKLTNLLFESPEKAKDLTLLASVVQMIMNKAKARVDVIEKQTDIEASKTKLDRVLVNHHELSIVDRDSELI